MTALLQRNIMPNGSLCLIRTDTLTLLKMHSVDLYCKMSSPGKSGSKLPLQKLISRKMKGQISFSKSVFKNFIVKAVQGGQPPIEGGEPPRRLVDFIRAFPDISRNYFKSPFRRALFGGISLLGGFYVAQTISLSFGALGVNDVIAAVLCVILTEYVTRFYYTRSKVTFAVALLNNFKMGFTYGLFIDAFKLAS